MSTKSKKTRQVKTIACAEGMTLHGYPVTREHIEQMAADYDQNVYCGRVNMDHVKTIFPDSTFRSYGLVSDVNTVELTEGDLKGKLGLEVTLEIDDVKDDFIVKLNQSGQKIFSSIEYWPKFPSTNRAYLTGIALTDYPAAVGSRVIELSNISRGLPETGNSYTASLETQLNWLSEQKIDHENEKEASKNFLSKVGGWLGLERRHNASENGNLRQAIELTAKQCGSLLDGQVDLENEQNTLKTELSALKQAFTTLQNDHDSLKQQLSREDGSNEHRSLIDGTTRALAQY